MPHSSNVRTFVAATLLGICGLSWPAPAAPATRTYAPRPTPPSARSARELVAQAIEAAKLNDYPRAAAAYETARAKPDFAELRVPLWVVVGVADHYFAQGTIDGQDQAMALYRYAETHHLPPSGYADDRALLRMKIAEVLMSQGRLDQAREELAWIRRNLGARRAGAYADLGDANLLLLARQPEAARDRLAALAELDDPFLAPLAMFSLGRAHVQLKQPDQAIAVFRKLWNRYGDSDIVKRAVFLVGQVYFDRGDFLEARKLFEACSVVGAAMQTKVRPGDELIVKVNDATYFSRTRSSALPVTLRCPSGDQETLKLEKNPVSDQLYVGRIRTALALPSPEDGLIQVGGGDEIEMTYAGLGRPVKIAVVDDGAIRIDSTQIADPPPRHERGLARAATQPRAVERVVALPSARQTTGVVNPGSPVYVQIVDGDLDTTAQPDVAHAEVLTQGGPRGSTLKVALTETGPRTGVFGGWVLTAPRGPTALASSEAIGHPASSAIDIDKNSPAPTTGPAATSPASRMTTFWQAKVGDKTPWLQIDLPQPIPLARLVWGAGEDKLAVRNMPTQVTITLTGDGPPKVLQFADLSHATDNIVELKGLVAKSIRFEIAKFNGESPAIGQFVLTDAEGRQLVPSAAAEGSRGHVLEFDVTQKIYARYLDEENETPGEPVMRESGRLGARYYDASLAIVKAVDGDRRGAFFAPVWRLTADGQAQILLNDPDLDVTPQADKAQITVFTEAGDQQVLELAETGPATGIFTSALPLSTNAQALANPRLLYVRPGDVLWMTCLDERNMLPGYKTLRHAWIIENRPTAGDFASIAPRATAWPAQVKPSTDEDAPVLPTRSAGDGRVTVSVVDPDAVPVAGAQIPATAMTLIGGATRQLQLVGSSGGAASGQIDLVLAPNEAARDEEGATRRAGLELPATGDDIVRLSFIDAAVPTNDLQRRAVGKAPDPTKPTDPAIAPLAQNTPVTPIIRLSDPSRRAEAAQAARLATLRTDLAARQAAYRAMKTQFASRRDLLQKRLAAPTTGPADAARESEQAALTGIDRQMGVLDGRIERLTALGATSDSPAPPATAPAIEPQTIAPLVPGRPFEVVIDDPDLRDPTINVRLRSLAGRLVGTLTVKAQRDAQGLYLATVQTRLAGEDADKTASLALVPDGEVLADYEDKAQAAPDKAERVAYVTLASDALLEALDPHFYDTVTQVRLGESVHLQVIDFDADLSDALDQVLVTAKSSKGDQLLVVLVETESHSGVFRGSFLTDAGAAAADDDLLQTDYAGKIEIVYHDHLRLDRSAGPQRIVRLDIPGGSDGTVEGFSRQFRDATEEMKLWYRTGLSAYHIGRRLHLAGAYEKAEENFIEAADYFNQLVSKFPEDALAASANYYLGNIQALKSNHREALARFQEVIARWPKSDFVPRARFKAGQAMEAMGLFDQAADAYVLLTYHHPNDEHVPMAMVRMMNHFARLAQYLDAVGVAQKFVAKFPKHEQAGAVGLRAGQWLAVAGRVDEALAWFADAEKTFAASDRDMPGILYWHAATLIQGQQRGVRSDLRVEKIRELLNRIIYDYRDSEYANLARAAIEQVREAMR